MDLNKNKRADIREKVNGILYSMKNGDKIVKSYCEENSVGSFLNSIKTTKKGSDVKLALLNLKSSLNTKKEAIREELFAIVSKLTEKPKESFKSNKSNLILHKYSYNQIYNESGNYRNEDEGRQMNRYNMNLFALLDYEMFCKKLDKAIDFINEEDKYLITPGLAVKLGL